MPHAAARSGGRTAGPRFRTAPRPIPVVESVAALVDGSGLTLRALTAAAGVPVSPRPAGPRGSTVVGAR